MFSDFSLLSMTSVILTWFAIVALVLFVPRNRKPTSAIAWLLVIFFLPIVGLVLFVLIGSPKLSKKRVQQQEEINIKLANYRKEDVTRLHLKSNEKARYKQLINLTESLGGLPVTGAEKITVLPNYNKAINRIVEAITKAEKTVFLEYFILALDDTTQPVFDAMKAATQRGVEVRVLFDSFGSKSYPRFSEMKQLLSDSGVSWQPMLPINLRPSKYNRPDLRNHRKIVTIDNNVGFIGSQKMIDRTYHRKDSIYYDELVAEVHGQAALHMSVVFASDWYFETGDFIEFEESSNKQSTRKQQIPTQILPSGSTYDLENNAIVFTELIHAAKKSIVITNPYFVPNEPLLNAIIAAVKKGVQVKILNSKAMDQWMVGHAMRSFYMQLLQHGIEIYLFKEPKLLHSKHITIDDDIAVIGSSNMDIRSFELNLECTMIVYDKDTVAKLHQVQRKDIANSKQVSLIEWSQRGFWKEFRDSLARLTAALQ